ncbi:MAG: alkaline phosphatase family protein [Pseudomonadota bacterium]
MTNATHGSGDGPAYILNYNADTGTSSIWKVDPSAQTVFDRVTVGPDYQGVPGKKFCAIGNYLLQYDLDGLKNDPPAVDYALFYLERVAIHPLSVPPVKKGSWDKHKFWQYYDHYENDPDATDFVQLVPMTGYVMAYMPTPARGTFMLWNFDPAPNGASNADPLPNAIGPQDALTGIKAGSQLLPMNNHVLEWRAQESAYTVWSFDPKNDHPLVMPPLSSGQKADIEPGHKLYAVGGYILDVLETTGGSVFRLWGFDPHATDPFVGPVAQGALPDGFYPGQDLIPFQPLRPVDAALAAVPATMDFMRNNIEHVVVYMLESRTLDSVLGWLYEQEQAQINFINAVAPYEGNSTSYQNTYEGMEYPVYKFQGGKLSSDFTLASPSIDPFHATADCIDQQFSGGFEDYQKGVDADMGGFVSNNLRGEVMASFGTDQLPVINGLAGSYAVSDMWFSSMPGGTVANRAFALSGSNDNVIVNCEGEPQYSQYANTPKRQSIWKVLQNNGMTDWKIYYSVLWGGVSFTYQLFLRNQLPSVDAAPSDYVQPLNRFYADVQAGTLPTFSFVEPAWIAPSGATSYHPGASGDMVPGEIALKKLFDALMDGPNWDKTALVITFSKGGGVYDHVPTPRTTPPWAQDEAAGFRYDVLGARVPTIVVSPRVKENTVFRAPGDTPFEATSLVATILEWCGVPRARWGMGDRIQAAPTFEAVFELETPRTDKPDYALPYDNKYQPSRMGGTEQPRVDYTLGSAQVLDSLFPPAKLANKDVGFTDQSSVIAHYTLQSLQADGFPNPKVQVTAANGQYQVTATTTGKQAPLTAFALHHQELFQADRAGLAIEGQTLLQQFNVWNPMNGYPVNSDTDDGDCKWNLFPPLGLNVMGQRGVLLMHYPPWQVLQQATFLDCMTARRWNTILHAVGIPKDEISRYRTIVDVNPIAAPGAGQSEYPNDYFPIMMASAFFDGASERNYIRRMLDFYVNGPEAQGKALTLPLLVCGSPLYDPQAPGWFRVAFKDQMPLDANGTPETKVLQAGKVRLGPEGRETPYLIANHMIAAGVTGKCTDNPAAIPDIRMYEAQDCVAASFLYEYAANPDITPEEAKARACMRWFGNKTGDGPPKPPDPADAQILCALAQMDLFYCPGPPPHPKYTFEEAMQRCAGADNDACGCTIGPGS